MERSHHQGRHGPQARCKRECLVVGLDAPSVCVAHQSSIFEPLKLALQVRWEFMWEAIAAIPEGPLREAAQQPDYDPPPPVMRFVVEADIGPIPDSEVDKLEPYIIDHSVLQRMNDGEGEEEEDLELKKPKGKK